MHTQSLEPARLRSCQPRPVHDSAATSSGLPHPRSGSSSPAVRCCVSIRRPLGYEAHTRQPSCFAPSRTEFRTFGATYSAFAKTAATSCAGCHYIVAAVTDGGWDQSLRIRSGGLGKYHDTPGLPGTLAEMQSSMWRAHGARMAYAYLRRGNGSAIDLSPYAYLYQAVSGQRGFGAPLQFNWHSVWAVARWVARQQAVEVNPYALVLRVRPDVLLNVHFTDLGRLMAFFEHGPRGRHLLFGQEARGSRHGGAQADNFLATSFAAYENDIALPLEARVLDHGQAGLDFVNRTAVAKALWRRGTLNGWGYGRSIVGGGGQLGACAEQCVCLGRNADTAEGSTHTPLPECAAVSCLVSVVEGFKVTHTEIIRYDDLVNISTVRQRTVNLSAAVHFYCPSQPSGTSDTLNEAWSREAAHIGACEATSGYFYKSRYSTALPLASSHEVTARHAGLWPPSCGGDYAQNAVSPAVCAPACLNENRFVLSAEDVRKNSFLAYPLGMGV